MKKTMVAVLGAVFLMAGCSTENTRSRTVTPEETREAGADALNTRGTGEDKDMVGTDSANSPWKDDVNEGQKQEEADVAKKNNNNKVAPRK